MTIAYTGGATRRSTRCASSNFLGSSKIGRHPVRYSSSTGTVNARSTTFVGRTCYGCTFSASSYRRGTYSPSFTNSASRRWVCGSKVTDAYGCYSNDLGYQWSGSNYGTGSRTRGPRTRDRHGPSFWAMSVGARSLTCATSPSSIGSRSSKSGTCASGVSRSSRGNSGTSSRNSNGCGATYSSRSSRTWRNQFSPNYLHVSWATTTHGTAAPSGNGRCTASTSCEAAGPRTGGRGDPVALTSCPRG